jgi:hypothetical protein
MLAIWHKFQSTYSHLIAIHCMAKLSLQQSSWLQKFWVFILSAFLF